MKTLFLILLIGAIAGAFTWQRYQRSYQPTIAQQAAALAERTRAEATERRGETTEKVDSWNLSTREIKKELETTGQVVRSRTATLGEKMDDVRIVNLIKSKYVVEKNLSMFDIGIHCQDGEVKLTGSVASADQVSRAMTLALQTSGVHSVISRLAINT